MAILLDRTIFTRNRGWGCSSDGVYPTGAWLWVQPPATQKTGCADALERQRQQDQELKVIPCPWVSAQVASDEAVLCQKPRSEQVWLEEDTDNPRILNLRVL